MSLLGDYVGNPRNALGFFNTQDPSSPDYFRASNVPRFGLTDSAGDTGQVALVSAVMTSVPVFLHGGVTVTNVSLRSGATAANGPTAYWAALYSSDATPALLAQTADQGSAAWAANTTKTLALATPQKITKTGIYWVGVMVAASTAVPSLLGTIVAPAISALGERNLSQSSGAGLSTTAPATITSTTAKNFAPLVVLT